MKEVIETLMQINEEKVFLAEGIVSAPDGGVFGVFNGFQVYLKAIKDANTKEESELLNCGR